MLDDFERALRRRGAVMGVFRGCALPAHFGDAEREWRAAREGCAVFAAGFRSLVCATGADRVSFLQGMLSNDVKALAPGQGVYAALLTQQGKVVSDLRVYADADRFLLDVIVWRRDAVLEALERFLVADEVELAPSEDEVPLLALEGPLAAPIAGEVLGAETNGGAGGSHWRAAFQGQPLRIVTASEVDGTGRLLLGSPALAAPLFDACCAAGARPAGMDALEIRRVEAGVPWPGVDIDDDTLIMETGREQAISFTKGCYLGQEVVERVAARGHVNRRIAGVAIEGAALPEPGAALLAEGREVGYVTSAVRSPAVGGVIALAMIHMNHATPGERLAVRIGGGNAGARVAALPFDPDSIRREEE